MSFEDFIHKYTLKNSATSYMKIQQNPSSLALNDVKIFSGNELNTFDLEIIIMHPTKATHWMACNK